MDTKSTNSKAYIFTKVIAVLLVVLTLGYSAVNITKAYIQYERNSTAYFRLTDAIFNYGDENAVYSSYIFENKMESYLANLAQLLNYYGSGSKEAYKEIVKETGYDTLKKNLIYNIFYRCNFDDESAIEALLTLSDGNVISMELIKESQYDDGYDDPNVLEFFTIFEADEVVSDYTTNTYYSTAWTYSQELEEALKKHSPIEMSARALGIACRCRTTDIVVKSLIRMYSMAA